MAESGVIETPQSRQERASDQKEAPSKRKRSPEEKLRKRAGKMEPVHQSEFFFNNGLLLATRTIYYPTPPYPNVGGEEEGNVDIGSARVFMKSMEILKYTGGPKAPIKIILNTEGGDEYQGMAVYDTIGSTGTPVTIEGRGAVMSMGVFILQAGTERVLQPNARLMVHYGSWGGAEHHSKDHTRSERENRKLRIIYRDVLWTRIKERKPDYTLKQMDKLLAFDTYLSAPQAIELGLADRLSTS